MKGLLAKAFTVTLLTIAQLGLAQEQQNAPLTPHQRVSMLKAWLKASQAQMRGYEWIETTVVSHEGEEKSRKQNSCYYGVDGVLQKIPLGATHADHADSGFTPPVGRLFKKVGEKKKADTVAYMSQAKTLIDSYIPPDPKRLQRTVNDGRMSVNPIAPGQRVRLDFKSYLKDGDVLSVDLELPTNRLLGISVASYMEKPADAISLNVSMGVLPDGTIYTAHTTLSAKEKDITVVVDNTGHRRVSR